MTVREVCQVPANWNLRQGLPYLENYAVTYRVFADRDDGPLVVAGACQNPPHNLPVPGDTYAATGESSDFSMCTTVRCERVANMTLDDGSPGSEYAYICEYGQRGGQANQDPPPGDVLPGDGNKDPHQRPEREWYEWELRAKPFTRDADGYSVVNSAQERLADLTGLTTDSAKQVHVVMQRESADTAIERQSLRDKLKAIALKTNSITWRGHAANTLLMRPPGCFGPRYENGKVYYEVTYRAVEFDANDIDEGAIVTPEDWGTHELVLIAQGFTNRRQVAITDGENTISAPVKLDGLGRRLADQSLPVPILDGGGGRPGPYKRYGSVDFNLYIDPEPA